MERSARNTGVLGLLLGAVCGVWVSLGSAAQPRHNEGAVVAWLNKHLRPIPQIQGPSRAPKATRIARSSFAKKLRPIVDTLSRHRVVGLGEATHGTREFFVLKGLLFQQLVLRGGFRTLAMELAYLPALAIDRYLQTGQGDIKALVKGSYFFLEARELVSLFQWMRRYNQTHKEHIRLVGIDLQPQQKKLVQRKCGSRQGCRAVFRDGLMAQNVLSLGGKTVVWAHNGHLAHFDAKDGWKPMGRYLQKALARQYYAVAFEFSEGGFIAPAGGKLKVRRTRKVEHLKGRRVSEYILPPAPAGSLAHRFAQARADNYFVDITKPGAAIKAFFQKNRKLQTYGALIPKARRSYEAYAPLHLAFDGLIFIKKTTGYTFP